MSAQGFAKAIAGIVLPNALLATLTIFRANVAFPLVFHGSAAPWMCMGRRDEIGRSRGNDRA